jgi:hypothetical protein
MDPQRLQNDLELMYSSWKANIKFSEDHARLLGPPLLIHVTDDYCYAEKRILVVGQETFEWGFYNEKRQSSFLRYQQKPHDDCVWDMQVFKDFSNAVDVLCRGYKAFDLARLHKRRNSPFWRGFREVQSCPQAGVLWGNLSRSDYSSESGKSRSNLRAPKEIIDSFMAHQKSLFIEELNILDPHICIFFTGPNYDRILSNTLPNCSSVECE